MSNIMVSLDLVKEITQLTSTNWESIIATAGFSILSGLVIAYFAGMFAGRFAAEFTKKNEDLNEKNSNTYFIYNEILETIDNIYSFYDAMNSCSSIVMNTHPKYLSSEQINKINDILKHFKYNEVNNSIIPKIGTMLKNDKKLFNATVENLINLKEDIKFFLSYDINSQNYFLLDMVIKSIIGKSVMYIDVVLLKLIKEEKELTDSIERLENLQNIKAEYYNENWTIVKNPLKNIKENQS